MATTNQEEIRKFARIIADDIITKGFPSIEGNLISFAMHWHSRNGAEIQVLEERVRDLERRLEDERAHP